MVSSLVRMSPASAAGRPAARVRRRGTLLLFCSWTLPGCSGDELTLPGDRPSPPGISIVEHKPNPSEVGRSVLVRVSLSPAPPGDEVDSSFTVTTSQGALCRGDVRDRTCEFIFSVAGSHTMVARLPATNGREAAESDPVSHTVNTVPGATHTSLGAGPDPLPAGKKATVFAKVQGEAGIPAIGAVNVYLNGWPCGAGTALGTIYLNGRGEGTLTVPRLPEGFHVVRGCFTGAPGFAPSEDVATIVVRAD